MGPPMAGAPAVVNAHEDAHGKYTPVPQMGTGVEFVLAGSQTLSRTEWASMEAAMTSEERRRKMFLNLHHNFINLIEI